MSGAAGTDLHVGVRRSRVNGGLQGFVRRLLHSQPALVGVALVLLLAMLPTALLMMLDTRQLLGISVWVKPLKFQLSVGTYLLTLAWVMAFLTPHQRLSVGGRYVTWTAITSALLEVAYISWQAAWGRASHFNIGTSLDATMYGLMGVGAVLLTSTALVLGVMVLRNRPTGFSPVLQQAVGWGLVLTCLLGTGFGAYLSTRTGHAVGGNASDAGGMWLSGWLRSGGDLRVAHFFGIHAVHAMVVVGWLLDRLSRRRTVLESAITDRASGAVVVVWGFALAYSLLCAWTLHQAMAGRPFLG